MPSITLSPEMQASILQAGAAVGAQAINAYSQNQINQANIAQSQWMYNQSRADSIADWNRQNMFNSPEEQMRRLKQAGLNPNLVYGDGAVGNSGAPVKSAEYNAPNLSPIQVDLNGIGSAVNQYFNVKKIQQDIDNAQALEEQTKANTNLINQRILDSMLSRNVKDWDWGLKKDLRETTINTAKGKYDLIKQMHDQKSDLFQTVLAAKKASTNKILNDIRIDNAKLGMEKAIFPSVIMNKMLDNKMKSLDNSIKKAQSKEAKDFFYYQKQKLMREASSLYYKNLLLDNESDPTRGIPSLKKREMEQKVRILEGKYTEDDKYYQDKMFDIFKIFGGKSR